MKMKQLLEQLQGIIERQPHLAELPVFLDVGDWCDEIQEVVIREHPIVDEPGIYIYNHR